MTYEEYEAEVKKHLTEKRFFHSQCVASCAAELAERYGANMEQAKTAGILHDIMKDTPKEEQLKIMENFGIILTVPERANPKLWHSIAGAAYCEHVLGVSDREILNAIACHTSGKENMTLLDKVLFVADYISADRDYPGVEIMREAARRSLEETIVKGIAWTMCDLSGHGAAIDPNSVLAYNEALQALTAGKSLTFRPGRYGIPEIETEEGEHP